MPGHSSRQRFSPPVFEPLESRTLLAAVPVVSILADTPAASENGDAGQFTVSRDVATAQPLRVSLVISGTAKNGTDYTKIPTYVDIPANAASAVVAIQPIDDGKAEAAETVVLTIKPGKTYTVDLGAPADTATIADATYLAADFFPLTDGARWDYAGTYDRQPLAGYWEQTDQAGGTQVAQHMFLAGQDNSSTMLFQQNAGGSAQAGGTNNDGDAETYTPPLTWLPESMAIGVTYTFYSTLSYGSGGSEDITETVKVVGMETITVPAGTFRCLKLVKREIALDSVSGYKDYDCTDTMDFARGVGFVKNSEVDKTAGEPTHKTLVGLTSWSISSRWTAGQSMDTPRDDAAAGVIGGKIYVFGGNGGSAGDVLLSTTAVYDPVADQWSALADNPHTDGVSDLATAVVNDKLYVFGAAGKTFDGRETTVNFVEEYDPGTDTWTSLAPKPTAVQHAPCVVYNGEIYLFGGVNSYEDAKGKDHETFYKQVEAYNPATNTWRLVTNMPKAISYPAVAVVGGKAYVMGGSMGGKAQSNLMAYDFATNTWTTKGLASLTLGRGFGQGNAAPVMDGKIYLVGEWIGTTKTLLMTNRVDIYDPSANTWSVGPCLPKPIGNSTTMVVGGNLYIIGGLAGPDSANLTVADVWTLALV
jgi:N-acetylneuraminic acid mutarotase